MGRRSGSGNGVTVRGPEERRRGPETMSQYYRRTGVSRLGGNRRTRGVPATITPVRGR